MANGDIAAAAGVHTVPMTKDMREGYDDVNALADDVAVHITTGGHPISRISGLQTSLNNLQAGINGKAPTAHTHSISQVTSLQSALNGKAAAVHTHDVTQVLWGNVQLHTFLDTNFPRKGDTVIPFENNLTTRFTRGPDGEAYNQTIGAGGHPVWMDSNLEFGRQVSARKYKEAIEPHPIDPAAVLALEPVIYRRKGVEGAGPEFGLIADDVEQTLPEVITYFDGEVDGIRYDLLSVALLDVVKAQQRQLDELTARFDKITGAQEDS